MVAHYWPLLMTMTLLMTVTKRGGLMLAGLIWAAPLASTGSMIQLALKIKILMTHPVVSVRMFREVYDEFIGHCCIVDLHLCYLLACVVAFLLLTR